MSDHSTKEELNQAPLFAVQVLALATLAATFGLIVLGSAVRVTNSGMGCKGWPLCSGDVGPISHFHPLMEQSHRYLASIVTMLIVALAIVVVRAGARARHVRGPALAAVGVIVVQIVLGAVTVLSSNAPITVALHLLVATLFLAVVTVTTVASFVGPARGWSLLDRPSRLGWAAVSGLYAIVISGSVVVDAGAQAACATWPVCSSNSVAGGLAAVQLVHRSVVLVGSILVVSFLVSLLHSPWTDRLERSLAITAVALLGTQVGLGALSALNSSHTELADLHLAVGSALWGIVVAVFALTKRERTISPSTEPVAAGNPVVAVSNSTTP